MPDVSLWPTVRDVALQLGVSEAYVRKLIALGRLHTFTVRLGMLIDPATVAAYEATRSPIRRSRPPLGAQGAA